LIFLKGAELIALSIELSNIFPPENPSRPMNSPQGIISPAAVIVKKHLPPPQGEISHISLRAVGAMIPKIILAKLPMMILWREPIEHLIASSTALIKYLAIYLSSGF